MVENRNRSEWAERIWSGEITPGSASSSDVNTTVVRRVFEDVWNNGKLDLLDELLDPDFIDHSAQPGTPPGIRGYKFGINLFKQAFPDLHFTLDQVTAEEDRVAIRLTAKGSHRGTFLGIPATNKSVSFSGMTFIRLKDGKVVERWGISDLPSLMMQLGDGKPPMVPTVKAPYSEVVYMGPQESRSTTRVMGVTNMCKATKEDTRGIFSLFVSEVPAGKGDPIHVHLKEDEAYYILSGEFEIYDGDNHNTVVAGPGSYVYVPMGLSHGFKNVSNDSGSMILVITPGGLEGFFEQIGQVIDDPTNPPPPPSGPPDFARAARIASRYNLTFIAPTEGGKH